MNISFKSLIIIMITAFISISNADSLSAIKGSVLGEDGDPLMDANVSVPGTFFGSATDNDGNFFIEGLKPGSYQVKCEYIGYIPTIAENVQINKDEISTVYFQLIPDNMSVEKLVVKVDWDKVKIPEKVINYRFLKPAIRILLADSIDLTGINLERKPPVLDVGFFEKMKWYMWRMFN